MRRLRQDAKSHLTVMTNAEVVCVDGVGGVEAVVVRYTRTGRLCAVNASAFLSCDGGEMLETELESGKRKSKSENGITGVRAE